MFFASLKTILKYCFNILISQYPNFNSIMDLDELQKQLYKEQEGLKEERPDKFEPGQGEIGGEKEKMPYWEKERQIIKQPWFSAHKEKILKKGIIILTIAAVIFAGLFFILRQRFDSSKVSVAIFSRDRVVSGEDVNYVVEYKNNGRITLKNVKLTFVYPEGSFPIAAQNLQKIGDLESSVVDLPDLEPGGSGNKEFRASLSGLKDEKKKASAKLIYNPANFSSNFENSGEFENEIFLVPLVLDFDLPEKVVSGQNLAFALKYLNTSDIAFSNLSLSVEYPQGFSFISSLPLSDGGSNIWQITEIGPKEEGKILISGVLTGNQGEIKTFGTKIEKKQNDFIKTLSENLASVSISLPPLAVKLLVNNNRDYIANAGDDLNYSLVYQNTSDVAIGPVFIDLKLDAKVLDLSTLRLRSGFFNNISNMVIWNESVLPGLKMLEPGFRDTIAFTVKVKNKDKIPIKNFIDKNFTIPVSVKIDTASVPISLRGTQLSGEDSLSTKLNSKLTLIAKGFYQDSKMPNSGPIPPRVGQTTTYTIYWDVTNLANDVENVIVEGYLPPYITWLNNFFPSNADIKYDKNSGKIFWTIGKLPANTGILYPVKELVFQIGLTPSSSQIGNQVELVKPMIIRGKDAFTGAQLENSASAVESNVPDDPSIGYGDERVVQ